MTLNVTDSSVRTTYLLQYQIGYFSKVKVCALPWDLDFDCQHHCPTEMKRLFWSSLHDLEGEKEMSGQEIVGVKEKVDFVEHTVSLLIMDKCCSPWMACFPGEYQSVRALREVCGKKK